MAALGIGKELDVAVELAAGSPPRRDAPRAGVHRHHHHPRRLGRRRAPWREAPKSRENRTRGSRSCRSGEPGLLLRNLNYHNMDIIYKKNMVSELWQLNLGSFTALTATQEPGPARMRLGHR